MKKSKGVENIAFEEDKSEKSDSIIDNKEVNGSK